MVTLTSITIAREKAVQNTENAKKAKNNKNGKNIENTRNSKNGEYLKINLVQVLYIEYLIIFQEKSVLVLLDLESEINAIHLTFTKELGFSI